MTAADRTGRCTWLPLHAAISNSTLQRLASASQRCYITRRTCHGVADPSTAHNPCTFADICRRSVGGKDNLPKIIVCRCLVITAAMYCQTHKTKRETPIWSALSEWVSVYGLTSHSTHISGHFGDESFQAINCTSTENQKQSNTPETQKRNTEKLPWLTKQSTPWLVRLLGHPVRKQSGPYSYSPEAHNTRRSALKCAVMSKEHQRSVRRTVSALIIQLLSPDLWRYLHVYSIRLNATISISLRLCHFNVRIYTILILLMTLTIINYMSALLCHHAEQILHEQWANEITVTELETVHDFQVFCWIFRRKHVT